MNKTYNKQLISIIIGVLLVILFFINSFNPIKTDTLQQILEGQLFNFLIYLVVRILSSILCVNIAKDIKRNIIIWGILGFLIPPVALIIIGSNSEKKNNIDDELNKAEEENYSFNKGVVISKSSNWFDYITIGLLIIIVLFFAVITLKNINLPVKNISTNKISKQIQLNDSIVYNKNKLFFKIPANWHITNDIIEDDFSEHYILLTDINNSENVSLTISQLNKDYNLESTIQYYKNKCFLNPNLKFTLFSNDEKLSYKGIKAIKSDFACEVEKKEFTGSVLCYSIDHKSFCFTYLVLKSKINDFKRDYDTIIDSFEPVLKEKFDDSKLVNNSFSKVIKKKLFSVLCPYNWNKKDDRLLKSEEILICLPNNTKDGILAIKKGYPIDQESIFTEESYLKDYYSAMSNGKIIESKFFNYNNYFTAFIKSQSSEDGNNYIAYHMTLSKKNIPQYTFYIMVLEDYYNNNKSEIDKIAFSLRIN
jgi:hypothetical protein